MKKLIFCTSLFILTFLFFDVKAQTAAFGIQGGISIPNLTSGSGDQTPLSEGYSSRQGAAAAIYLEFKVSDVFSFQPQLEYSSQGGKKNGFQAFTPTPQMTQAFPPGQAPQYLYANYNSTAKMNYIMLPLLAKLGWNFKGSPWRFYVDAGPFVALLASAHQVTTGSSEIYADQAQTQPISQGPVSFNNTQDIKDQLHAANFGIEGNIGFAYRLKKGYFFIQGGGNYGFVNIQKNAIDGSNNTGAATVTAGYAFLFGK